MAANNPGQVSGRGDDVAAKFGGDADPMDGERHGSIGERQFVQGGTGSSPESRPAPTAAQVQDDARLVSEAKDRIARVVVALQDGSRPALERLAHEALDLLNQVAA